jgi:glycerol uptake facilitator-like aquaporin
MAPRFASITASVLSPGGKPPGAHFNPAVTFTFYRLRKVALWDAVFYCVAQFLGADARDPVRVQSRSPGVSYT